MRLADLLALILLCTCTLGGPPPYPICNGSRGIRLSFSVEGGFTNALHPVTHPYGHAYLFVDGRCQYVVNVGGSGDIRTGTLSSEDAEHLSDDLALGTVARAKPRRDAPCPDGGEDALRVVGGREACICNCDDDAPAGLDAALRAASTWSRQLALRGEPADAPPTLRTLPPSALREGPRAWPFLASPMDFRADERGHLAGPAPALGATDAATARTLRNELAEIGSELIELNGKDNTYPTLVLDGMPSDWAARIQTWRAESPR